MRLLLLPFVLFVALSVTSAEARHRGGHRHWQHSAHHAHIPRRHRRRVVHYRRHRTAAGHYHFWQPGGISGLVTVPAASGHNITVAKHLSGRFQAMIADFVAAGYKPRAVGCYASRGHVTFSRHYHGAACDFDQSGWGKTASFMYSAQAHAIIAKHGFRNGCSFRDCGHVDDGFPGGIRLASQKGLTHARGRTRRLAVHRGTQRRGTGATIEAAFFDLDL